MVLSLVPGIFLARMLTKAEYGTYQQVMLIAQFIAIFIPLGIPSSLYFFIPKDKVNQRNIIIQTGFTLLFLAALGCIIVYVFRFEIAMFFNNMMLAVLIYFVLGVIFSQTLDRIIDVLILIDKAVALALSQIIDGLFILLSFLAILYYWGNIKGLFLALIIIKIARLIYVAWCGYKLPYTKKFRFDFNFFKSQFQYSLPLAAATLTLLIGKEIDKAIVSHFLPIEEFAVYGRGAMELPIATIITASVTSMLAALFVQKLSDGDYNSFVKLWHDAVRIVALILFPIFIYFVLVSNEFITLMYSDAYAGSTPVFLCYLCLLPTQITAFDAIIRYAGKTRIILFVSGMVVCVNIILSLILVKNIGAIGPAIATMISNGLILPISYIIYISKFTGISFKSILPWRKLGAIMLFSILSGLLALLCKLFLQTKLIVLMSCFGVFVATYPLLIWKTGLLNSAEKIYCKEKIVQIVSNFSFVYKKNI